MLGDNFTQGFPAFPFKALLEGQKKPSSNALQRFQGILIRSTMSKLPAMPSERCLQQIPDQFGLCCLECSAKVTHSVDVECVLVQDASHEHRILTLAEYSLCAPRQVLGSVDADWGVDRSWGATEFHSKWIYNEAPADKDHLMILPQCIAKTSTNADYIHVLGKKIMIVSEWIDAKFICVRQKVETLSKWSCLQHCPWI